jgi:hypothetical protein
VSKQKLSENQKTTIIIAVITTVGTIVVAYFSFRGNIAPTELSLRATQTAEAKAPTLAFQQSTSMPLLVDETPTVMPSNQPTVQIVNTLPSGQNQAVQLAASGILQVAQQLPLIVRDNFDTNDYGWSEAKDIVEQGIECNKSIKEGKYSLILKSTSQVGAWCIPFIPRKTNSFYLSVDTQLVQSLNTDILLYYRYNDESNFNYLIMNTQTQTISLGIRQAGKDNLYVQSAYIPSILKDEANKLTLLALTGSQTIYINDQLEILISNESILNQGQLRLGIRLNEANQTQELLVDNYELRGD